LDEEMSKNVGLAQQNGFDPTFFFKGFGGGWQKAQHSLTSTELSC
jgi:hypothetical protein